jgi:outer membrane protein TolC
VQIRKLAYTTLLCVICISVPGRHASGQTLDGANSGSIATPRPINPSTSTTNPSARETQNQNPYLGSVPTGPVVNETLSFTLQQAVERGLKYNLGLIDSIQADAAVRAQRLRALAALLPNINARAQQAYENISYNEIGLKVPPIGGFTLPPTSGAFGFQDARISATQSLYSLELTDRYRADKALESASLLNTKDSRDVVVFAVGLAFFQVVASKARLETAQAQLAFSRELDSQVSTQYRSEVSPEIDAIRAQVERQTAEQRVTNAANELEKDKLTLGRIIGLPLEQKFMVLGGEEYRPLPDMAEPGEQQQAMGNRADLASAQQTVRAAELTVNAEKAQRMPALSLSGNYGTGGTNFANANQLYEVSVVVSVPIFTGGRIKADIDRAEADLERRRAEYQDLEGRVKYDIRVACLDLASSESSVNVAANNKALAARALVQSQDRYNNGVTNYLEVVQAEETFAAANDNYIQSLYSFNVSKIALARALGNADSRLNDLFGGN